MAPAIRTWTGAAADNLWTSARNWTGNVAPTPGLDDLVFPSSVLQLNSVNNFPTGAVFRSITLSGGGYSISGNPITLGDVVSGRGSLTDKSAATTNRLTLDMSFVGTTGIQTFSATPGTTVTIAGKLSGAAGVQLNTQNTGTLVFSGNNSGYSGPITVKQGVLQVQQSPTALGTGTTTVLGGAALHVKDVIGSINSTMVLSGTGISSTGVLNNISGNNVLTGNVTFGSNLVFGSVAGEINLAGTLGDNNIGYTLTKTGPGKVIFSHANTYAGSTIVSQGVLNLRDPLALGKTSAGTTVGVDAALELEGVSVTAEKLSLSGSGILLGGALRNVSGTNAWTGDVTLATDASIGSDEGSQLTVSGVIKEGAVASGLTKEGTGRLVLTRANSYSGVTTVDQGVMLIQDPKSLGTPTGGTVVVGRATLETQVSVIGEHIDLNGPGVNNVGALRNVAGMNTWTGDVSLPTDGSVGADQGTQLTITGVVDGPGGLTKFLPGKVVLTNANTYIGTTIVDGGVLNVQNNNGLGTLPPTTTVQAGTIVRSGAALEIEGVTPSGGMLTISEPLTLEGTGVNNTGALRNVNGNNLITGDVLLTGNATIGVEAGAGTLPGGAQFESQLELSGDVTESNPGFGLTKVGPNRLILSGHNRYTGSVFVNQGTLNIQHDFALGSTTAGTTVLAGAALELQGGISVRQEPLTVGGQGLNNQGAILNVADDNQFAGNIVFSSNVGIGTGPDSRLTLRGRITDSLSGFSMTKRGAGKLVLGGNNNYGGGTQIEAGIVNVQNSSALGSNVAGTTVANGAALEMQTGVSITDQRLTLHGQGPSIAPNIPVRWFPLGPAPIDTAVQVPEWERVTGRVTSIAPDPSNPAIMYVGTASGGIWKTRNGGITWFPVADYEDSLFIGAVAVSPSNPSVIYAGTGEANWFRTGFTPPPNFIETCNCVFVGKGVLKSTDGGATWDILGQSHFDRQAISEVVVDPTNPDIVYVTTTSYSIHGQGFPSAPADPAGTGVWKSTDGGLSWTNTTWIPIWGGPIFGPSLDAYTDLVIDPQDPLHLYTGVGTWILDDSGIFFFSLTNGIWETFDGGVNWFITGYSTGLNSLAVKIGISNPTPGFAPVLYAASMEVDFSLRALEVSFNGGATWTDINAPQIDFNFYNGTVAADPVNPFVVYAGGVIPIRGELVGTAYVFTDLSIGGDGRGPHVDHHTMAFDKNGKLLDGNDGGVWRLQTSSLDPSDTRWVNLNSNMQITQFVGIATHPSDPSIAYGGSQDNGTEKFTGNATWTMQRSGDGGFVRVDPSNPNTVYHTYFFAPTPPFPPFLERSDDGGRTWQPKITGINTADLSNFYPPYIIDASNPRRLLLGTDRVYETTNRGDVWAPISAPNTNGWDTDREVDAIGVASGNSNIIYAVAGGNIFVTLDHGSNWAKRNIVINGVEINDELSDIAVDPTNPRTAYVTRVVYNDPAIGGRKGHVFRTTDFGQTWFDISGSSPDPTRNLPDVPAWKILIDPRPNPHILYVGTDQGVYRSTDIGLTWSKFGVGMPNAQVRELILDPVRNYITAGTFGRGMFRLELDSPEANSGSLRGITGINSWSGNVALASDSTVGADVSTVITLSGFISDPSTQSGLTKAGVGRIILTNANTYGGATLVKAGTLEIQNSQSLGRSGQATVNNGGTLAINGDGLVYTENLVLNGAGAGGVGALTNAGGFNTWVGNITLATDPSVSTTGIGSALDSRLTISGIIGEGSLNASLTKEGLGTVVLTGANTYGGNTTIDAGILNIQHVSALGRGTGTATVNAGAALELEFPIPTDPAAAPNVLVSTALALNGTGVAGTGALRNLSGYNIWTGNVTLQTNSSVGVDNDISPISNVGSPLIFRGVVGDNATLSGLTKVGGGKLILARTNTYQGFTNVVEGVLNLRDPGALGSSLKGTTVENGAAIELESNVNGEPLTLNGTGIDGTGALRNIVGNNTWSGTIDLATTSSVGVELDSTTNQPLTLTTTGNISGLATSVLVKVGDGTLIFPRPNDYLGQTLVATGILNVRDSQALGALGGDGTFVNPGATLQLERLPGNPDIVVRGKTLGLSGTGVAGRGALENLVGNNTWEGSIILDGVASINVDNPSETLIANRVVTETFGGSQLIKNGPGTLEFQGDANFPNDYTGATLVNEGTLSLNKVAGVVAVSGPLVIGDGVGAPGSAVVRWQQDGQLRVSPTTVFADGTLDLNGHTDTAGTLTIDHGTVATGAGGDLTVAGKLTLIGGTLSIGAGGAVHVQAGAGGTSGSHSQIIGPGVLDLGSTTQTFDVTDGPAAIDMEISAVIIGSASAGLTKTGNGVLDLTANNTYPGTTTVSAGTLLVDGSIGNATVQGGVLGGVGTVGQITATGGVVNPGGPGAASGQLNSGAVNLGAGSGMSVDLNSLTAGSGYDVLNVNGTVSLGGALSGTRSFNPAVGDNFTIITSTGPITGSFSNGNQVYISGFLFTITYNANSVVLTHIKAPSITTLSSSANPSVFGQPVTFTATVSSVVGTGAPTGTVVFTVDGVNQSPMALVNGQVSLTLSTLAIGNHTLSAAYSGDADFDPSTSASLSQTVNKANSTVSVASSSNPSVSGELVVFTATVAAAAPGAGTPTGSVVFTVDGVAQPAKSLVSGLATLNSTFTVVGNHTVSVAYSGDGNFNSSSSALFTQTVNKANVNVSSVTSSLNPSIYGQSVAFSTTVTAAAPGSGVPTGTVTFFSDGVSIGSTTVDGAGGASLATSSLTAGAHNISATYNGDIRFNTGSTTQDLVQGVSQSNTTSSVAASNNPTVFGETVTFTATVAPVAPGAGTATGTVTFTIDSVAQPPVALDGTGQATLSVSTLSVGTHLVRVAYSGDTNFLASQSANLSQTVNKADTNVSVTSSSNPSVFGQAVTFTATVAATPPGAGLPTGTVTFVVDGQNQTPVSLNTSGQAAITRSFTSVGIHTVSVLYNGDGSFNSSATASALNQTVNKANTATANVTTTANPIVFGQTVIFTTTVTAAAPGSGTPTGTVTFLSNGANIGTGSLDANGVATLSTSSLPVGTSSITASYGGDGNFNSSSTTAALQEVVNKADTSVTTVSSSLNPSVSGEPVTFTASVSAVFPGAGTPTGVLIFRDGGSAIGSAVLVNGSGSTVINTLTTGNHVITADYQGDGNFNFGTSTTALTQIVNKANSTSTIASSANPSVFGETVTFTATVSGVAAGGVMPTGSVTFTLDGSTSTRTLTNGQATLVTSALAMGGHTVSFSYSGDANFNPSSSATLSQSVVKAETTTSVASSSSPAVFGQGLTLTGTVSALAPGAGTPTGQVTFKDGTTVLGTGTLAGGSATLSLPSGLSVGTHVITLSYAGDVNFNANSAATPLNLTVNKADTATSAVASSLNPSVYGQNVTFSTTVSVVAPGAGSPSGTVTFFDGTTPLGTSALNNGAASLVVSSLGAGAHAVTATYNGDGNFASSTSTTALSQAVQKSGTTVANVTASPNPSTFGQSVALSTIVQAVAPGAGIPTGTVTFYVDGSVLTTGTVDSLGVASATTTTIPAGVRLLTASYDGDANFNTSTTAGSTSQTVTKANTTASVASDVNPSVFGQLVTFTATLTPVAPGGGTPTGTVSFSVDGVSIGTALLTNGSASLGTAGLSVGNHIVSVSYAGDSNFNGSGGTLTGSQFVNRANTVTSDVTSAINPSVFGQSVNLSVVVSASAPGAGTPSGTVLFDIDGNTSAATLDGTGRATLAVSSLTVGSHSVAATYQGDGNFSGSSSANSVIQTVNRASTATTITSSAQPSVFGQTVTFTASVAAVAPGSGTPTGTVTFSEGSTSLGTAVLTGGAATLAVSTLTGGDHTITAQYNGDGNFNQSTGSRIQTVRKGDTSLALSANKTSIVVGKPVTFSAVVSAVAPATGNPSGLVSFFDNGVSLGQSALVGDTATLSATLAIGTHNITATYLGDGNFNGVSSNAPLVATVMTRNQAFVSQVYVDLLHRTVDPTGFNSWSRLLDQGGTRLQVVQGIQASGEYRAVVVDDLYHKYLHRHADQVGLQAFTGLLQRGGTIEQVQSNLIGSDEYFALHGATNETFLDGLYVDVLGRNIDAFGLRVNLILLQQFTPRSAIASNTINSPEGRDVKVDQFFQLYLHRSADPNGLAHFTSQMARGVRTEEVIAQIVASDEYFGNL